MNELILENYGLKDCELRPLGSGLINLTWKVQCGSEEFVLQQINTHVFKEPEKIAENISAIGNFLRKHHPEYLIPIPVHTKNGLTMVNDKGGSFRLLPFIKGSHTIDVVASPKLAYQAALKFGEFTRFMQGFDTRCLHYTIPDFHNLELRYKQFTASLGTGNTERKKEAGDLISFLESQKYLVNDYILIKNSRDFTQRVTHHDTKISNVLFDDTDSAICIIDLDTIMPGYFISDLGDMMRTYLSPVDENEKDIDRIQIRLEYFTAVLEGYLTQMNQVLTALEKKYLLYAGKFMIYMQALRFLSDYLNNDIYYPCAYEKHNYVRALNQIVLLQRILEKEKQLTEIIQEVLDKVKAV